MRRLVLACLAVGILTACDNATVAPSGEDVLIAAKKDKIKECKPKNPNRKGKGPKNKAGCSTGTVNMTTGGTVEFMPGQGPGGGPVGGVTIQPGSGVGDVAFTLQFCDDLEIDNPLYGSCMEITTDPEVNIPPGNPATVFICDAPPDAAGLTEEQEEEITLHRKHDSDPVEALAHRDAPLCGGAPPPSASLGGFIRALATFRLKEAGRQLAGMFQPTPLYARRLNEGAGGAAEGDFSLFQFAGVAKMEADSPTFVDAGGTVTVTVRVTDLSYDPVPGATVHFAASAGTVNPASALSDGDGLASAEWTVPISGGTLMATGFGIADPENNGPRRFAGPFKKCFPIDADCFFDPFLPIEDWSNPSGEPTDESPVPLELGTVTFTASGSVDLRTRINQSDLTVGKSQAKAVPKQLKQ